MTAPRRRWQCRAAGRCRARGGRAAGLFARWSPARETRCCANGRRGVREKARRCAAKAFRRGIYRPQAASRRAGVLQNPLQRLRRHRAGRAVARLRASTRWCWPASPPNAVSIPPPAAPSSATITSSSSRCLAAYEQDLHQAALRALELNCATVAHQRGAIARLEIDQ